MLRSMLIGLTAGARSMTPLALVTNAARTGTLPDDNGAPRWLGHPLFSLGAMALAFYEFAGDKQKSAPDRIIPPAILVRSMNAAFAGMALSPKRDRLPNAAVAGATAILASYATFALRMLAMRRHGQASTGAVEDALVLAGAIAAARAPIPTIPAPTRAISEPA
ncbi:DUF4126 domain-containing protein [Sphingomonas sp. RS6]